MESARAAAAEAASSVPLAAGLKRGRQHFVIRIDLDNFGVIWPILHAILGQRPERPKTSAQCQHHIGSAHQFHTGFRSLVT